MSNDKEDKAETLSITLRQGYTQELPGYYYHHRGSVRGVELIQQLAVVVFNLIEREREREILIGVAISECSRN